jgi:MATE family multidrug resistance protein
MTLAAPATAAPPPIGASFGPRLRRHLAALFRLAAPVMLSRAGILLLSIADFAMAGRVSVAALNGISLGFSVFIPIMVAGVGLTLGVVSAASRQFGAGDADAAARTWARGMHLAVALGLVGWLICAQGGAMLAAFGQAPALAVSGGASAVALAPGVLGQMVFMVCAFYLESSGRAMPALAAMAAGNLLNLALNAALIPSMGGEGAAWASSAVRIVMALALIGWVLRDAPVRALGREAFRLWGPGGWAAGAEIRAIGLAGGAAGFFETAAFASLIQAAGLVGPGALAAYSIAHSTEALVFMTALGLATAAGVQVGAHMGAGRRAEAAFAGWTGLGAAMTMTGAIGVVIVAFPEAAAGLYTDDPAVIARVSAALGIVAVSLVFDAGQAVMGQCVRALGDTWVGALLFFIAFFGVMAPLGWALALLTPLAEKGLFLATAAGCLTAVVLMAWRFARLTARPERAA